MVVLLDTSSWEQPDCSGGEWVFPIFRMFPFLSMGFSLSRWLTQGGERWYIAHHGHRYRRSGDSRHTEFVRSPHQLA